MTEPANDSITAALPDLSLVPVRTAEEVARCCGNCRHYQPTSQDGKVGNCRRVPPTPILIGHGQGLHGRPTPVVDGYFAPVNVNIWCSEFTAGEAPRPPDIVTVGVAQ